jgi:hypothetical protein
MRDRQEKKKWEIDTIVKLKMVGRTRKVLKYKVKWINGRVDWRLVKDVLPDCEKALSKFYKANPKIPGPLKNFEFTSEKEDTDDENDNRETADKNDHNALLREVDI